MHAVARNELGEDIEIALNDAIDRLTEERIFGKETFERFNAHYQTLSINLAKGRIRGRRGSERREYARGSFASDTADFDRRTADERGDDRDDAVDWKMDFVDQGAGLVEHVMSPKVPQLDLGQR